MRLTPKELGLIIGTLLACSATAHAATAPQFALQAVMVNAPPKLDGTLNDPAWQKAAHVELGWDFTYRRAAEERTDAYLLIDKNSLYVGFSVQQSEAVTATQHTNDVPLGADDVVRIYLWPGGDRGFEYGFISNPIGTRYEFSSENSAFAPAWEAAGKPSAHGYTVTERIPLDVMRGDGRGTWRIQFDRRVEATNTLYEWSHADAQGGTDSILYTGYLSGMELVAKGARTKPRLQLYTLGEAASTLPAEALLASAQISPFRSRRPRRFWERFTRTIRTSSWTSKQSRRPRFPGGSKRFGRFSRKASSFTTPSTATTASIFRFCPRRQFQRLGTAMR